jgi:hypothetical protein
MKEEKFNISWLDFLLYLFLDYSDIYFLKSLCKHLFLPKLIYIRRTNNTITLICCPNHDPHFCTFAIFCNMMCFFDLHESYYNFFLFYLFSLKLVSLKLSFLPAVCRWPFPRTEITYCIVLYIHYLNVRLFLSILL